jgi:mRNA interferase YafQ
MAFEIITSSQFKNDLKKIKKRSAKDFDFLSKFVILLQNGGVEQIPSLNKPHKLKGNYKGTWESHIKPNLLIIWFQFNEFNQIELARCGTHADLF